GELLPLDERRGAAGRDPGPPRHRPRRGGRSAERERPARPAGLARGTSDAGVPDAVREGGVLLGSRGEPGTPAAAGARGVGRLPLPAVAAPGAYPRPLPRLLRPRARAAVARRARGRPRAVDLSRRRPQGPPRAHFHRFYAPGRALPSLAALEPGPALWISPADAAARGVADGADIRVFNERGEMRCRALVAYRGPAHSVWMPDGWDGRNRPTA